MMPFKCLNCKTVIQSMEQAECECENPYFVQCALVHYLHPEGPGQVYSKAVQHNGASVDDEGFSRPLTVKNMVTYKLCCKASTKSKNPNKPVTASILKSIVSCPDCLAFIETRRNKICQLPEAPTQDSTVDSILVTPKSDSANPTVTMDEQSTSTQ